MGEYGSCVAWFMCRSILLLSVGFRCVEHAVVHSGFALNVHVYLRMFDMFHIDRSSFYARETGQQGCHGLGRSYEVNVKLRLLLHTIPTFATFSRLTATRGNAGQSPDAGDIPGPVLCLDEFLETEDPRVRRGVEDGCAGLCAAGVTIVFATHVMEHVDGMLASRSTATSAAIGPRTKILDVDSGGDDGGGGEHVRGRRGTVVTFTAGRAGEVSDVGACTYVGWKKGEAADRRARQVI